MKKTSRILAILLAALLLVGVMATGALGAETAMTDTGTVTITNAVAGVTYDFFRILDISGIAENGNAAFITNAKWHAVLRGMTGGALQVHEDTVGSIVTLAAGGFTPQEFSSSVLGSGAGIGEDATLTVTTSGANEVRDLQYGYYIMRSSRTAADTQYATFTLKSDAQSITEKNPHYPQIEKTVNGVKTISADFGQVLEYKIVITAAAGTDTYTIEDTMPAEIDFNAGTLAMKKIPVTGAESTLTEGPDYTVTRDGKKTTVVLSEDVRNALVDGDKIVLDYKATVLENTNMINGYNNNAKLFYTKDGNPETLASSATVFSGYVSFHKLNSANNDDLAGAKFVLKNDAGKYAVLQNVAADPNFYSFLRWDSSEGNATVITTTGDGTKAHTIRGLKAGSYTLVETEAPANFVKAADTVVSINENKNGEGHITGLNTSEANIYNTPGSVLPGTGGIGTTIFYIAGGLLVLCALALVVVKRRKAE